MHNHIMIDLETLGTSVNAPVISIGACAFDISTGKIDETTFYRRVDWASAVRGRKLDVATIKWWMEQSEDARREVLEPGDPIENVLTSFNDWIKPFAQEDGNVFVWGNGACFDITILETLYDLHDAPTPWQFWEVRDVRTIVHMADGIVKKPELSKGTAHHALDDAVHQAKYVSKMWQTLTSGFED